MVCERSMREVFGEKYDEEDEYGDALLEDRGEISPTGSISSMTSCCICCEGLEKEKSWKRSI